MKRIHVCAACQNERNGVKTRIAVPHTCEKGDLLNNQEFQDWIDRCNIRDNALPVHIKYKMYLNHLNQKNRKPTYTPEHPTYTPEHPFIVAEVREYLDQLLNEEITFSRFVELLNTRPKMQKP